MKLKRREDNERIYTFYNEGGKMNKTQEQKVCNGLQNLFENGWGGMPDMMQSRLIQEGVTLIRSHEQKFSVRDWSPNICKAVYELFNNYLGYIPRHKLPIKIYKLSEISPQDIVSTRVVDYR